ncbi:TetR/AcrR family transcriptional regulator [Nocardiopsis alba]|uniref:TetR/AcrR family transcriptional regulator n=1 Tax=Nocardiopsis alba TaxID=53437 RepID=UPI00365B4EB1
MTDSPSPTPPFRTRRSGGARRAAVLEVAAQVIVERGYERTRFSDVSQASGVAVSTLQFYFGSRDDMLIEALYTTTDNEVRALEQAAFDSEDPWRRILELLDHGLATLPVGAWRMLLEFWYACAHDEELRQHSVTLQRRYRAPFLETIKEGVGSGRFTPKGEPEDCTTVILSMLDGLLVPRVLEHTYINEDEVKRLIKSQVSDLLGVRES